MPIGTKTDRDLEQYRARLGQVLRQNLRKVLQNDSIITDRKAKIRIPWSAADLPYPRVDPINPVPTKGIDRVDPHTSVPGDILGRVRHAGSGAGHRATQEEAEHGVDLWVEEKELYQLISEEWKLPHLLPGEEGAIEETQWEWDQRGTHGSPNRILRRRTIRSAQKHGGDLTNDDLWYRQYRRVEVPKTSAVVFFLRDISGSMASPKITERIRVMGFVLTLWLRQRYPDVAMEFIAYDHRALRVQTEQEWFGLQAVGGTRLRSALDVMVPLLQTTYPVEQWQWYQFVWTDGEEGDVTVQEALAWLEEWGASFRELGWIHTAETQGVVSLGTWAALGALFQEAQSWQTHHPEVPLVLSSLLLDTDVPKALQQLLGQEAQTAQRG